MKKNTKKPSVPRSAVRRDLANGQFKTRIEPAYRQRDRRMSGRSRRDINAWIGE